MKRLFVLGVAGLLALAPAGALAQGSSASKPAPPAAKQPPPKAPAAKTLSATGTVSAVTATSLAVKGKAAEWTFAVGNDTKVTARGASTKTAALKKDEKPTVITEYVNVGDTVTVTYHDMGATKHAATVRVTKSKTPPPPK
jgi:hypothetical protein